jgi:hypothetical protein
VEVSELDASGSARRCLKCGRSLYKVEMACSHIEVCPDVFIAIRPSDVTTYWFSHWSRHSHFTGLRLLQFTIQCAT